MSELQLKRRRHSRNLLIYPRFQLRLLVSNLVILMIAFSATAFQSWRSFKHIEKLGLDTGLSPQHPFFRFIEFQSSNLMGYLAVAFAVATLASLAYSLYLSHRVAGPIVRLKGYLTRLEESSSVNEPLQFRDGDFFEDLPEKVNGAIASIQKTSENSKKAG